MEEQDLPHLVMRACMQVHQTLGAGLSREVYEECLAVELRDMEMPAERGCPLNFNYRGWQIKTPSQMDFIIAGALLVRVLAVDEVSLQERQFMETWLRLTGMKMGMIVNFQVPVLRKGIHRITLKRKTAG
ncbi:MAG TPA: hypothetical protein DIT64_14690 [Verrucomicrobiales bacterium]|nr:hypothetical protein [Verrucomicrobiales bacterium]HCN77954.1 hypothetical protein [Verrucomicrobiales bacterium]HRJ08354.1 GxxExxY protein [Prosthecobacter sp.]HRK16170.1 GxxExxY protein [Prosthecobacter sp.]